MATTSERLTALEKWKTAHDALHASKPLHTHTPEPAPIPTPTYTFFDDFSSGTLSSKWTSYFHVPASLVKIWNDPADLAQVKNGMLELSVQKLSTGEWRGGLVDTSLSFKQLYGRFGVRVKITQGKGLFPAPLWLYADNAAENWENE